jgi:hypothetical protein
MVVSGVRVQCPVCGKKGGSRMPRGGDGSLLYPRRHPDPKNPNEPCPGTWKEASVWL